MATGTGLQIPKLGDERVQPIGIIDGDKLSAARSWTQIAAAGEEIAKLGADSLKVQAHQREVGFYADQDTSIDRKKHELRNEFKNDPDGFDRAWQGFRDGKMGEMPAWAVPKVKTMLGAAGNSAFGSILGEKTTRDTAIAKDRWTALADQTDKEVMAASMAGDATGVGLALEKYSGIIRSGIATQFLAPEEAERRILNTTHRSLAANLVRETGDEYKRFRADGDVASTKALHLSEERILRNPQLKGLSEEERYSYFRKATGEIRALEAERKQDLGLAKQSSMDLQFAMSRNVQPDQGAVDSVVAQLMSAGGHKEAAALRAAVIRQERFGEFSRLPLHEQTRALRDQSTANGSAAPPAVRVVIDEAATATGVPASYLYRVAGRESSYNPNAQAKTSSAGGLFQFIDSTWERTLAAHGSKYGLAPGTPKTDPRANALMGAEFTKENASVLTSAGVPITDQNLYLAHFAGARGAVQLLQADQSGRAAQILPAAANANRTIFYNPDGSARTVGQVISRLNLNGGGGGSGVAFGPGSDFRLVAREQKAVSDNATAAWSLMEKDLDLGSKPNSTALQTVMDAATAAGNHELLEKISARLGRYEAVEQVSRQPIPQQHATLTELERQGGLGGLSPGAAAFERDLRSRAKQTREGLDNNPIAHTVANFGDRYGTPQPINPTNSEAFRSGLRYRAGVAAFARENWQTGPLSALDQADIASLKSTLEGASPDNKLRMFADLAASLPEEVYRATMDKLGNDTLTQFVGTLARDRPELAREILRGDELMKIEKTGDKANLVRPAFQNVLGGSLYPSAADQNNVTQAAMALYTARRGTSLYDPTETSGIEKAIEDVTGKIVKQGGMKVAIPIGMTAGNFSNVMSRLTPEALGSFGGAFDRNGRAFDAKFVGERAVLKQMGPGDANYLVGLPDATARDGFSPIITAEGAPLVVDVKALAAGLPPAPMSPYQRGLTNFRAGQAERIQDARRQSLEGQ